MRSGGHVTEAFDLSSLAKISDGYTAGHIKTAADQILSERRITQVER